MERATAFSDADLLRRWADDRSPDAFDTLVRRHAGLVHAVATRAMHGDPAAADDVTQAVFVLLAEKAGRLDARPSLSAWLHRVTCYAAANARRIAGRRTLHERAAAAERPEASMPTPTESGFSQEVDSAINRLRVNDRRLLLERYVVGQDDAALAEALGLSRATLQRRLSRALERLRSHLGGSVSVAALPALLTGQSPSDASTALIRTLTQTAAGTPPADAVGPIVRLTRRRLAMDTLVKVGTTAVIPVAVLGLILAVTISSPSPADPVATTKPAPATAPAVAAVRMPTEQDVADLDKRLIGRWRVTGAWSRGREAPKEQLGDTTMVIENHRLDILAPNGKGDGATFTLSPGERWVQVDLQDDDRPDRVVPGIVKIENDEVWFAFDDRNRVRPQGFPPETVVNKGWRLERIKP